MAAPQKKDPNKYAKHADIQADTLVKTLTSVGGMILMLIGIAGIAMEFFKDGGVITKALSWLFDTTTHMMFIPVIVALLWLANRMMSSTNPNESKKAGQFAHVYYDGNWRVLPVSIGDYRRVLTF